MIDLAPRNSLVWTTVQEIFHLFGAYFMSATGFRGIYPMLYAFFNADGGLDRPAMAAQVAGVVRSGSHGVALGGLATETNKLSTAERRQLLDWVAEDLAGQLPLSLTIAENSIAGQVEMAAAAKAAGAAWVALQPPPVKSASEADLIRFYGAVADQCELPVGIQNAPEYIGIGVSNQGFATLNQQHPNVSILKAEGPATYIRQLVEDTDGVYTIFNGRNGIELVDSIRAGCSGIIPSVEACDVQARIFDDLAAGNDAAADQAFAQILPLTSFLMHSLDHLNCYGKRLAARRLGIVEVHDRIPAQTPHPYGMEIVDRWSAQLPQHL
jgi:2-keto-3-deoxy-L-arabinonate dehydratase